MTVMIRVIGFLICLVFRSLKGSTRWVREEKNSELGADHDHPEDQGQPDQFEVHRAKGGALADQA